MEENISKVELERKNIYRTKIICIIVALVINVIGIVVSIFMEQFVLFIVTLIVGIIIFGYGNSRASQFSKKYKNKIVSELIDSELGQDAQYFATGGVNLAEVISLGIYQRPDQYHMEDHIISSYNGVNYQMCDAKFEEMRQRNDGNGRYRMEYVTYFFGKIIKIDYQRDIDLVLKIIEGTPLGFSGNKKELVETEIIDFNKKFNVYASSKEKAFYYLTPLLLQKILELEKLFKGSIQLCFTPDFLYIFINNSTDSLEISISKPIDLRQMNILRSQITIAASIINEFGLDENKFNKE